MDTDSTVIEVLGVPSILSVDQMIDKLTIHFLRPRNGGGEVERVVYPARNSDKAFISFELPEVATRVLEQSHVLEVEGGRFPLKVRRIHCPEVDMPVSTTLDLGKFRSQTAVKDILTRHKFEISYLRSGQLLLVGTFLNLKAARVKLGELLLSREAQSQSSLLGPHFSAHTAGPVSKTKVSPDSAVLSYQNGVAVHAGRKGVEETRAAAASWSSSNSTSSQESGAPYSPPSYLGDTPSNSSHRRQYMASHYRDKVSFVIDANALRYAQCFYGDVIQETLQTNRVEMKLKDAENLEVSTIVLVGSNPEIAKDRLAAFLMEVHRLLRVQEIPLASLTQEQRVQLDRRIRIHRDVYKVLVQQVGDTLQLLGPSSDSYELKQRILGEEVSLPTSRREGRALERSRVVRRSSSLPRQLSKAGSIDSEPRSTVDQGHSWVGRGERTPKPASPVMRRTRTNSESNTKVKDDRSVQGQAHYDKLHSSGTPRADEKPKSKEGIPSITQPLLLLKNKLSLKKPTK
ncbi:uncharacterized protein si:dkey-154b15.1 [Megalops cyprinoides]|uniref:uncharacterized protein si:dkey-154b15.1 n=1 Tax=Megalops cyprinoides TaxID=118141 RepID=UPI00186524F5|nr:uncharacterized protein si:dkey-154b15.1 [Megalops cyprinoides]